MKAIFVTFNCFKSEFRQDDSFSWLTKVLKAQWEGTLDIPDIVAIGLQEFLPFDKAFASGDNSYEELFQKQLHNVLERSFPCSSKSTDPANIFDCLKQENMQFTPIKRIRHVGNALFLFSKRNLCVSSVSTAFMGSGWFYMGNKGAVAIKCSVESKDAEGIPNTWTLCVVSCHFDAHKTDPFYRNNQFRDIPSRIIFEETVVPGGTPKYSFIEDQDVTILLGDLNYRVYDSSRSASELISLYQSGQYTELRQFDQLSKQLSKASNSFMGCFAEAKITFPPTYKYLLDTETINTSRIPSWCDRILIRSPDFNCQVLKYFSVPSCQLSDHKPVIAFVNLSPESTPTSRARAKSIVTRKDQSDSHRAFKQRVGTTVDATANVAVNLWVTPLRIPFVVLGLAIIYLSLYSRK